MSKSSNARILVSVILFVISIGSSIAQDIRFSQFYQAPLYLNPAFTGTADVGRAGLNYRLQGTSSQSNFTTLSAYVDYNFVDYQINAGFLLLTSE
ncbi:MAG: type IX secretion system membrane protein PorP/SprF [Bacteroidota bacterium]